MKRVVMSEVMYEPWKALDSLARLPSHNNVPTAALYISPNLKWSLLKRDSHISINMQGYSFYQHDFT